MRRRDEDMNGLEGEGLLALADACSRAADPMPAELKAAVRGRLIAGIETPSALRVRFMQRVVALACGMTLVIITAGIDLAGYTLPAVVADMEAARAGLGYERIDLLARGYGTRLAQIYADLHPDRTFRSALIGPGTPGHTMIFEPKTLDPQIEYYARLCAKDAPCSARISDLAATMRNVTRHMSDHWLIFPIDTGKVRAATFLLLKRTGNAAMVFDAYRAAEQGDPSGLLVLQLLYNIEVPITWYYRPQTKISPLRDSINMVFEVLKVRRNGWRGKYDRQA